MLQGCININKHVAGVHEYKKNMLQGWVWTMCSQEETLISGAWDNTLKFWQVRLVTSFHFMQTSYRTRYLISTVVDPDL